MDPQTFVVEPRPFESDFFSLSVCRLGLKPDAELNLFSSELSTFMASSNHDVIETNLDMQDLERAPVVADNGFRLVDSRITFVSLVAAGDPDFVFASEHADFEIRMFEDRDLDQVVELTHTHLTNNAGFVSRYKDEAIFGKDSGRRWFGAWIQDMTSSDRGHTAVATVDGDVVGFFTYENRGVFADDLPLYKGILVAVDPRYRGSKLHLILQSYLFNTFPESSFYIENATQLSNYAVIKNHVRSNRHLKNCDLTYMWAQPAQR